METNLTAVRRRKASVLFEKHSTTFIYTIAGLIITSILFSSFIFIQDGETRFSVGDIVLTVIELLLVVGFGFQAIRSDNQSKNKSSRISELIVNLENAEEKSDEQVFKKRLQLASIALSEELSDAQVEALLPDSLKDRAKFFIEYSRDYQVRIEKLNKISQHLESDKMQEQLISVACKVGNFVLDDFQKKASQRAASLNVQDNTVREKFGNEVARILAVWLPLSLRYDTSLPLPSDLRGHNSSQPLLDGHLYVEAIERLRNTNLDYFWIQDEEEKAIVRNFLEQAERMLEKYFGLPRNLNRA